MKKDVFFCNLYYKPHYGGIESVLFSLSKSCIKLGLKPKIICCNLDLDRQPTLSNTEVIDDIEVIRYSISRPSLPLFIYHRIQTVRKIRKTLNEVVPDGSLIIARDHLSAYAATGIRRRLKSKVIYIPALVNSDHELKQYDRMQEYVELKFNKLRRFIVKNLIGSVDDYFQKRAIKRTDMNFVSTDFLINDLRRCFPEIPENRYNKLPFGVDTERFSNAEKQSYRNRKNKKLRERGVKRTFVFLGRLVPHKGLFMGLAALGLIRNMDFKLYVIGDGPLRKEIENIVNTNNLNGKVTFLGAKLDPENYLTLGDVLFFPSVWESFGNTILEGMSCGLPVLCFKHKPPITFLPNEEIVENGKTGWVVEPDVESYAEQLEKIILMNDGELEKMKDNARKRCKEKYSWDSYLRELLAKVNELEEVLNSVEIEK